MIDRQVEIHTQDGFMNTFVTHPEDGGPFPVVLFLMDAPGVREELEDMARRLATAGYYVLLPNLYYRRVREFRILEEGREAMFEHMESLTNAIVNKDVAALLEFTDSDDRSAAGPVGVVGYCMSGPFAFSAASCFGDRVAAAASIHGVRLVTDQEDSPHLGLNRVQGELYFACAQTDEWAPAEMVEALESHLLDANVTARVETYPATGHGFVFPQREGHYDKQAAERHWERLYALFARNLRSPELSG